jgi:hypothetical protein
MGERLRRLLIRIRGALGLTAIGGLAGGFVGAAMAFVEAIVARSIPLRLNGLISGGARFAIMGASAGLGFSVLLGILKGKRQLRDVSTASAAALGAVAGALFPLAFFMLEGWAGVGLGTLSIFFGVSGALGAGFGSTAVAVAKRAERAELSAVDAPPRLPE